MGMVKPENENTRRIYAIGQKLGMVERGNHEDALHILVAGVTGKTSVKELTHAEALAVLRELGRRSVPAGQAPKKKARQYEELPGGVTAPQQRYVWFLMMQLEQFDPAPTGVQLRDRLCGIITKQFKVTAFPAQPFRFLTMAQGGALIEGLKSLTTRAEEKYLHSPQYREKERRKVENHEFMGT